MRGSSRMLLHGGFDGSLLYLYLIFKTQAMSSRDKDKDPQFVNDLLRTEFHKCVIAVPSNWYLC